VSLDLLSSDVERLIRRFREELRMPEDNILAIRASIEDGIRASPLPSSETPTLPQTPRSRGSSQSMRAVVPPFPLHEDPDEKG